MTFRNAHQKYEKSFPPRPQTMQKAPLFYFGFFLLPAGEIFIPYYYGKAIDSIVVHQSMEYLAKPVVIVSTLALAR